MSAVRDYLAHQAVALAYGALVAAVIAIAAIAFGRRS